MRNYLCLLVWLFCLVYSVSGQTRVGNPDDRPDRIERPCRSMDLNCIRIYFEKHAKCKKSFGPVPDPLFRPHTIIYYPRVNLTVTAYNQKISGLDGRVEDFYINKDTDKAVLAVDFRQLNESSYDTYFRFHRRAREPIVTKAEANVTYESVVITAVIPKIDKFNLEEAVCTAFVNDATPRFYIGRSATDINDPQVQQTIAEFIANPALDSQELFLTDSSYLMVNYIQHNICDFGLKVT